MNDDVEPLAGWWEPLRGAIDAGAVVAFPMTVDGVMRRDFAAWCFAMSEQGIADFSHAPEEFFDPVLVVWFQDTDLLKRLQSAGRPPGASRALAHPPRTLRNGRQRGSGSQDLDQPADGCGSRAVPAQAPGRGAATAGHDLAFSAPRPDRQAAFHPQVRSGPGQFPPGPRPHARQRRATRPDARWASLRCRRCLRPPGGEAAQCGLPARNGRARPRRGAGAIRTARSPAARSVVRMLSP